MFGSACLVLSLLLLFLFIYLVRKLAKTNSSMGTDTSDLKRILRWNAYFGSIGVVITFCNFAVYAVLHQIAETGPEVRDELYVTSLQQMTWDVLVLFI
jgi:flagellar biogenesis protein FliO